VHARHEIDLQARGGSTSVLASRELCEVGECRMAQGSEIEEGSSVALDGDTSSREAPRGGYSPLPVTARPRSLALGSRTAALQHAVARPFQPRATAQIGPLKGEVTASRRGATAGFFGQMHGRLGARFAHTAQAPDVRLGAQAPDVRLGRPASRTAGRDERPGPACRVFRSGVGYLELADYLTRHWHVTLLVAVAAAATMRT
jgi:hypothetical protein